LPLHRAFAVVLSFGVLVPSPLFRSRSRPPGRRIRLAGVAVATAALVTSCGSATGSPAQSPSASAFRGDQPSRPIPLPAFALHDTFRTSTGATTTLAALQRHRLMLVYFGYTHCPDVCPTTMADLGVALRQLPTIVQARTQVVFITSDPQRDTPDVMKAWLAHFDPSLSNPFIGLTASSMQIDAVAKSVGVPIGPPVRLRNGSIVVQHGAQTLAFVDGRARVLWLAGTQPADYAHDIATLAARVHPA
jgi:protein SCO1/2